MKLKNFKTQKEYNVTGPVYENKTIGVWCGIAKDPEFGECFIKIFNYSQFDAKKQKELLGMAFEEADTLKTVSTCSDKVPRFYDSWHNKSQKQFVIVMQRIPGITLRKWMEKHPVEKITDKDLFVRAMIIKQIAMILQSINSKIPSIVHRDIKPENFMIRLNQNKWEVFLIDFGCARLNYIRNVGTRRYQAPEQSKKLGLSITSKTDVFSLGLVLYELLTGEVPQLGYEFIQKSPEHKWAKTPTFPETITSFDKGKNMEELFHLMTEFEASKRIDYSRIINQLNYNPRRRK